MSPQVFTAALFLVHLYLEPLSGVSLLAQSTYDPHFLILNVLDALFLLLQKVRVEAPDRIQIIPSEPFEKSTYSQRLLQLWSDKDLDRNSLFMSLKNGIMLGIRDLKLLDYWLTQQISELTVISDSSTQDNSISCSLWQFMRANHSAFSDFLSILFSRETAIGSSINVFRSFLCLCRFFCPVWHSIFLPIRSSSLHSRICIRPILIVSTIRSLFLFLNVWLQHRKSFLCRCFSF